MTGEKNSGQTAASAEPAARPIAEVVGDRIRKAREAAGLRQADLADAAATLGFSWGRSSVAALEAGNRKLSIEELVGLNTILEVAGLRIDPLIADDDKILMSETFVIWGRDFRRQLLRESEQYLIFDSARNSESRLADAWGFTGPELHPLGESLDPEFRLLTAQVHVDMKAMIYIGALTWPNLGRSGAVSAVIGRHSEAEKKIADKLGLPTPILVRLMARALWGCPLEEERDRRAKARGDYAGRRALQSARGYVTRELTAELKEEWGAKSREANKLIRSIASTYGDAEGIERWFIEMDRRVNEAEKQREG
ncbi:helix-turn-helix domain-containing protein [Kitasatospora acidiphila]|uniref:helix-turn-helix domain-containing protein n=1 Tax=Kitasatospora acidiphila TaxID=2567942 RepID=UPI003C714353